MKIQKKLQFSKFRLFYPAAVIFYLFFALTGSSFAKHQNYDVAYIWDADIETVLDYKEELEDLLGPDVSKKLRVVGRGEEYGIIYDRNGSARSATQIIIAHSEILRKADLSEAYAVEDKGYYNLYNVSYGLGPNLNALKKKYGQIYRQLGVEVGKNLFIEETDQGNYTLIYRRRGDNKSTNKVARKHGRLLKSRRISTSITLENNNLVVYGESSYLDGSEISLPLEPEINNEKLKIIKTTSKKRHDSGASSPTRSTALLANSGKDTKFEQIIEDYINGLRKKGKISSDERTSWMVYDFTLDESLVDINVNDKFQAASMIKPFVALAFFNQVKKGRLKYGPKSRRKMEAMIQRSNNSATNWVMKQVGGPASCEKILRKNYGHIFKNTEIKEYIPAGGRTYKNSSLPSDYIRFLKALWEKELPYGKEMRRLMALPGRDRLYDGTPIPQGTLVYNKTGSTAHLCGDMGILVPSSLDGQKYPYAIVGIIERSSRASNYGSWKKARSNVIRQVSTLVYKEMKKKHKLL